MTEETPSHVDPDKYGFTEKQTRVLIEDFRKDFKMFGESLSDTNRKVDVVIEEVAGLKEKMTSVELDIAQIKRDIQDLPQMKRDIADIKAKLEKPAITRVEFDELTRRVKGLEMTVQEGT